MRMKHYRAQIDRQNEVDLQDIEQKHKQHLVNLMQTHEQKTADLQRDYEIQISKAGEALKKRDFIKRAFKTACVLGRTESR